MIARALELFLIAFFSAVALVAFALAVWGFIVGSVGCNLLVFAGAFFREAEVKTTIGNHRLIHGECLAEMMAMDAGSFDCIIADPPYCSAVRGGTHKESSATKYTSSETQGKYPEFMGDNRDQRSFLLWCVLWLAECRRVCRDGGAVMVFCDYRNLAAMIDAIQAGGWAFDGVVPWIKKNSRPRLGWFQTSRVEYVVVGRRGKTPATERKLGPAAVYGMPPSGNRLHQTQKPIQTIQELIEWRSDWQNVLDPFGGAGSTAIACENMGRRSTSIEFSDHYFKVLTARVAGAVVPAAVMPAAAG